MADVSIAPFFQPNQQQGFDSVAALDKGSIDPARVVTAAAKSLRTAGTIRYLDETPKYYFYMEPGEFSRQIDATRGGFVSTDQIIILPLPRELKDMQLVTYDRTPLNPIIGNALNVGQSLMQASGENETKNVEDVFAQYLGVSKEQLQIALEKGIAGGVASLPGSSLLGLANYSPNQFLTILLRGPQYKEFSFSWEFAPKTESEAMNLAVILTTLKNYQAPGYAAGGAFFRMPKVWKLAFMPNSGFLYKFKHCVISRIIVDYAGGGPPMFLRSLGGGAPDNPPALYKLNLAFTELEFWLHGNYRFNNDPWDTDNRIETSAGEIKDQLLNALKKLPGGNTAVGILTQIPSATWNALREAGRGAEQIAKDFGY